MSALAIIGPITFGLLAVLYGILALKARAGTLPLRSAIGLHNRELEASEEAWETGHRAAWPILGMAAAVSAFHAIGSVIAGVLMGEDGRGFLTALVVSGIVVVLALWFVASAAAVNAVKRME